jgi:hypothetical protein
VALVATEARKRIMGCVWTDRDWGVWWVEGLAQEREMKYRCRRWDVGVFLVCTMCLHCRLVYDVACQISVAASCWVEW